MGIVWKRNGRTVSGPEAIPDNNGSNGSPFVRASYSKPVELQSMGFLAHPDDVAEHRRKFPDVELKMDNGCAIPVMHSLGQKRAYLKATGWADVKDYR
jgi:hypothetical protein